LQWKVSNRSVSGASDAQARADRRWSCRGTWSLVKSNPTKYLPSRPDLNYRKSFEMSLVKGSARAVPDFAKLHALEEQRVARWKRQHKKDLTGCRFPGHKPGKKKCSTKNKLDITHISIPLDLSSRPFIPPSRFMRSRRAAPLLAPSLVFTPR
jgi:hypothetical protein